VSAQITWSADIAPIIYKNCSNCHNSNGIAPFELMNYQDASQNGTDIKDQVLGGIMPPWPPDPSYSHLAHERILTQQQITDIANWVDNGMPRGDSTLEPAPPVFNSGSEISNPDLILHAPVYAVNTTNDVYRCFVIPTNLLTNKYITGLEAIPGDRSVVHHILIYSDTTNIPSTLDALDPGPGYTNFGGTGSSASKLIGVWVPGQSAYYSPAGMGIRLPANSNVVLQIHYPGGITGKTDSTKLLLKLSSTFQREISIDAPLEHLHLDNGPLIIPANTTRTFYAHYQVPVDLSVLGVGPHMHLIGTSILSFGITPTNDTIPFIRIPHWDFHWQGVYSFPNVLKIPAGTILYSEAHYDNTSANPENPNNPPQLVHLGESTTDEMMLVYFAYTPYYPGDENIIIDSSQIINEVYNVDRSIVTTPQLYAPSPNPGKERIAFQYYLPQNAMVHFSILDITGKVVKTESKEAKGGMSTVELKISELPSGIYFLNLNAGGFNRTKKFLKE
jgi:hypothetical protein